MNVARPLLMPVEAVGGGKMWRPKQRRQEKWLRLVWVALVNRFPSALSFGVVREG